MKRRIILMVPPAGSDPEVDELLGKLFDRECTIVSDEDVADEAAPEGIRIIDLCSSTHDKKRVMGSGLVTLADVTALTAYEAWRRLGGTVVPMSESTLHKRGMGSAFKHVCQMMSRMGLTFSDLDPASFEQYEPGNWARHGLKGRAANILTHVEVYDVRIFLQLTGEDIAGFHRCGTTFQDQLVWARDRLKAEQAGA